MKRIHNMLQRLKKVFKNKRTNVNKRSEWVSVKDRLPTKCAPYLTQNCRGMMQILDWYEGWNCCFDSDTQTVYHDYELTNIVAWMHLPEPYKE